MKRTIIDIVKIMVAAIVAMGVVCVLIMHDASDGLCLFAYLAVATIMTMVLGVFDEPAKQEQSKHESVRHYDGRRHYGQAAVFLGAACIFIGTPKECEEMADDLQHYAQQVRVDELTGEETNFEIL